MCIPHTNEYIHISEQKKNHRTKEAKVKNEQKEKRITLIQFEHRRSACNDRTKNEGKAKRMKENKFRKI